VNPRSAAAVVRLAVLLFAAGAVAFALSVRTPGGAGLAAFRPPPAQPHPSGGIHAACPSCHGADGVRPSPSTHRGFGPGTCPTCHGMPPAAPASPR
jgi:cytochrome c553